MISFRAFTSFQGDSADRDLTDRERTAEVVSRELNVRNCARACSRYDENGCVLGSRCVGFPLCIALAAAQLRTGARGSGTRRAPTQGGRHGGEISILDQWDADHPTLRRSHAAPFSTLKTFCYRRPFLFFTLLTVRSPPEYRRTRITRRSRGLKPILR